MYVKLTPCAFLNLDRTLVDVDYETLKKKCSIKDNEGFYSSSCLV